ncbi:MAG: hypothetical protein FJ125_06230 [Deltaproteobacteria bacterium]|nr:hypothetical protein [Deltaproteobacteria bacterium]
MDRGLRIGGGGSDHAYFGMKVEGADSADTVVAWGDDAGDDLRFIFTSASDPAGGTEYLRVTSAGKVGIGTTAPGAKLEVNGEILAQGLRLAKVADPPADCAAAKEGSLRYNSTSHKMELCNGTSWIPLGVEDPCYRSFASCLEIRDASCARGDGSYTIDPDGLAGEAPFVTYCDMTTDGGGWSLVAYANRGSLSAVSAADGRRNLSRRTSARRASVKSRKWRLALPRPQVGPGSCSGSRSAGRERSWPATSGRAAAQASASASGASATPTISAAAPRTSGPAPATRTR